MKKFVGNALSMVLVIVVLGLVAQGVVGCVEDSAGPSNDCGDCPADVSWDAGVERCRNNANGQFAKSCCCGR